MVDLYKLLTSASGTRIPAKNISILTTFEDTTRSRIIKSLHDVCDRSDKDSILYIHFACHGFNYGENFALATSDTDMNHPEDSAIIAHDLARILRTSSARGIIIVADCCGGAAIAEKSPDMMTQLGDQREFRILLSSSKAGQSSWEIPSRGSVFHQYFSEALRGKMPGTGSLGQIYFNDLFDWVVTELEREFSTNLTHLPIQQPQFYGSYQNDPLIFVLTEISLAAIDLQTARFSKAELARRQKILLSFLSGLFAMILMIYWLFLDQHRYWKQENDVAVLSKGYFGLTGFGLPKEIWQSSIDGRLFRIGSPISFVKTKDINNEIHESFINWYPASNWDRQMYDPARGSDVPDKENIFPGDEDEKRFYALMRVISRAGQRAVANAILESPSHYIRHKSVQLTLALLAGGQRWRDWLVAEAKEAATNGHSPSAYTSDIDLVLHSRELVCDSFSSTVRAYIPNEILKVFVSERIAMCKNGVSAQEMSEFEQGRATSVASFDQSDAYSLIEIYKLFASGDEAVDHEIDNILKAIQSGNARGHQLDMILKIMTYTTKRPCLNVSLEKNSSELLKQTASFLLLNCDDATIKIENISKDKNNTGLYVSWSGKFASKSKKNQPSFKTFISFDNPNFTSDELMAIIFEKSTSNRDAMLHDMIDTSNFLGLRLAEQMGLLFNDIAKMATYSEIEPRSKPYAWKILWTYDSVTADHMLGQFLSDGKANFNPEIFIDAPGMDEEILYRRSDSPEITDANRTGLAIVLVSPEKASELLASPKRNIRRAALESVALRIDLPKVRALYERRMTEEFGNIWPWDAPDLGDIERQREEAHSFITAVPREAAMVAAALLVQGRPLWTTGMRRYAYRLAKKIQPSNPEKIAAISRWTLEKTKAEIRERTMCRSLETDGLQILRECSPGEVASKK